MSKPTIIQPMRAVPAACAVLNLAKIKGLSKLNAAVRHNHRAWAGTKQNLDHVDPDRTHLNTLLRGAELPAEVLELRKARMATLSKTVRKDAVLAIELMVNLPAGLPIDEGHFFRTSVSWMAQRFGADNIVSAVVHNDESAPHLHALVVPIKDGSLTGSSMLGYGAGFRALLRNFQTQVAASYGLIVHQPIAGAAERRAAAAAVFQKLRADRDPVMSSAVLTVIEQFIANKPGPFAAALGLRLQTPESSGPTLVSVLVSTTEEGAAS
jgi:hypothetical protein